MNYLALFSNHKETSIFGRYITLNNIEPLLAKYKVEIIGKSVLDKPIYKLQLGTGKTRIFMWSQMHGNESTTTKAIFDLLHFLTNDKIGEKLLQEFTFCILPMVNPDGATLYTRENANAVDLNRDAKNLTQPESILLRKTFEEFKPHFCYNLHDQRTIYGVADTGKPATVSFLAPAYNEAREINASRQKAINIIVAMNKTLQEFIPGQVGRFDDGFNDNCIGDTFQMLGVPTVLFEAGHFQNDYDREETRKFIFFALLSSLCAINENDIVNNKTSDYLKIPQNKPNFFDFIYKNIKICYDNKKIITTFAAQYSEELFEEKLVFNAYISQIDNLDGFYGHLVIDANGEDYQDDENEIYVSKKADFYIGKYIQIINGNIKQ